MYSPFSFYVPTLPVVLWRASQRLFCSSITSFSTSLATESYNSCMPMQLAYDHQGHRGGRWERAQVRRGTFC